MTVFVDTSAFYAQADARDPDHPQAARTWARLVGSGQALLTTSYVLLETIALLQRRGGIRPVRQLQKLVLPLVDLAWVDARLHAAGFDLLLKRGRRRLSLVDCVSFAAMRAHGLNQAFAFDPDFAAEGFAVLPEGG